jgi:hypothetical protein
MVKSQFGNGVLFASMLLNLDILIDGIAPVSVSLKK